MRYCTVCDLIRLIDWPNKTFEMGIFNILFLLRLDLYQLYDMTMANGHKV